MKKTNFLATILILLIVLPNVSEAAIAEISHDAAGLTTINPAIGFPFWYEDVSGGGGDRLQPCLAPDPNCAVSASPNEFFYYMAAAKILNVGPVGSGTIDFNTALVGADQRTFLRISLGAFGSGELSPNSTYNVTHPFGLPLSFTTDATGAAGAVRIQDGGVAAGDFVSVLPALNTGFSRFINAALPIPPVGYIGNPAIAQTLEGSGILTITGPNIGGQGINAVSTNLFNVAGKIAPNNPPVIDLIPPQTGTQDNFISFTAAAADSDFDPVTFSIISRSNLANENNAAIDPATGVFSWTPNAGGIFTFSIGVSDGRITVATNVAITVSAPSVLTRIAVSPASFIVIIGATKQFTAAAFDQFDAPIIPLPAVDWRTDNGAIATIDRATGLATAVASGNAIITARSGNVSGTASLTVVVAPVCETAADIDLSGTISNLEVLNYVRDWKAGAVTNLLILRAIIFWKAGIGC